MRSKELPCYANSNSTRQRRLFDITDMSAYSSWILVSYFPSVTTYNEVHLRKILVEKKISHQEAVIEVNCNVPRQVKPN